MRAGFPKPMLEPGMMSQEILDQRRTEYRQALDAALEDITNQLAAIPEVESWLDHANYLIKAP
jgi:hypothetical protein